MDYAPPPALVQKADRDSAYLSTLEGLEAGYRVLFLTLEELLTRLRRAQSETGSSGCCSSWSTPGS